MSGFKSGDRVRRSSVPIAEFSIGDEAVIAENGHGREWITLEGHKGSYLANRFELVEDDMSSIKITYKEDSRPIKSVEAQAAHSYQNIKAFPYREDGNKANASSKTVKILCNNGTARYLKPDVAIEFAEAIIKLAKQVKNS